MRGSVRWVEVIEEVEVEADVQVAAEVGEVLGGAHWSQSVEGL